MPANPKNPKLTDIRLRALLDRPPVKRIELKDGTVDGLTLRIGPRGRPTWSFRFRIVGEGGVTERGTKLVGSRYHRVSLGTYPDVGLKEARRKAAAYLDDAAAGRNPILEFEEQAIDKRDTVANLVDDYIAHAKTAMRSWRNAKWNLNRHIVVAWGSRPVGGITERDARNLIDKVAKGEPDPATGIAKPRPGAASEARKWGSMLFEWGRSKGRVKANPFAEVKAPKLGERRRYLSMEEARAVWEAAGDLGEPWCKAIRLLMLTGCREMEICGARRSWLDLKDATLLIPPEIYKSGRHFLVTLPAEAVAIFEGLPRWNGGDYLLSTTNGEKPIAGVPRKIVNKLHVAAEAILGRSMDRFALHDLRRTVRTHLARLGVDDIVAEMVLGHALKGLQASYNVYGFAVEKRRALESWAAELTTLPTEVEADAPALDPSEIAAAIAEGRLSTEAMQAIAAAIARG